MNRQGSKGSMDRSAMPLARKANQGSRRNSKGDQIAEAGPMLFIILFIIFFPLLDLVRLGFAFGAGWYLNYLNARIVSINAPLTANSSPGGPVDASKLSEVANEQKIFMNSGFGGALLGSDDCKATYLPDPNNLTGDPSQTQIAFVKVQDTVRVKSFAFDPLFAFNGSAGSGGGGGSTPFTVPGIDGVTFVYTTNVLQEEKGQN